MEREELMRKFQEPGPEYRSAPFWSWNDKIKPEEVCRQLDLMKQGGYGGGFMHSRVGLITPYLGKEWMKAIKAGIDYAKKNNLLAYLYDEDRWPSGFAGGITTSKKECQAQTLAARKDTKGKWSFKVETAPVSEWWNNTPYLNTLKKEAVAEFLRNTYEVYAKEVGKEFGKTIPAIFTDEPTYTHIFGVTEGPETFFIPYTDQLPSFFRKEYNYEIEPNYVSLFEKVGDWKKVRHHYWRLVAKLFQKNFGRQIYDWCEEHHIALTGHYLCEDTLESQTEFIGAAMPLYEYMHIPGVDHLCNNIRDLLTLKQCSSVAHQLGKRRVLSELYGASGQNMTFLDRKWIGDWHFALGINLFCPHLWLYSMAGCRKRDFPPTLSYQQPYWLDNKPLEDYFSRTAYLLSRGKFVAVVLVLHPIESGFMLFEQPGNPWSFGQNKEILQSNDSFVSLLEELLANHFEFDLGDETILARHGKVSEKNLSVSQMAYPVVVLPEVLTIRRTTFDLLLKFINAGGKVYSLKTLPELIEGEKDKTALKTLTEKIKVLPDITALLSELGKALPEKISIREGRVEAKDIYLYRKRLSDKKEVIFLANTSKEDGCQVTLFLSQTGLLENCDGFTGKISPVEVEKDGKGIKRSLDLPPGGSSLLMFQTDKEPVWAGIKNPEGILIYESSTRDWQAMPLNLNSLTLDNCAYRLGNQKWQKPIPVLKLQGILEKKNKAIPVSLRFTFKTELKEKTKEFYLVMERPEQFRIKVNGKNLPPTHSSPSDGVGKVGVKNWWIDTAFRKIDIKNLLRLEGENMIELKTKFKPPKKPKTLIFREGGTELESIYLVGDFGVKGQFCPASDGFWAKGFVITSKTEVTPVSLTDNGYPFYAGRLRYSGVIRYSATPETSPGQALSGSPANGSRVFLELVEPSAITHRIKVNGKDAGLILLPPYRIEVTGLLKEGENRIEIESATSLRNLLGPHHHKLGEAIVSRFVGPEEFLDPEHWVDDYHLVSTGLNGIKIYLENHLFA